MKIYEIGTGYTPIPAKMGAATEIVVEELTKAFLKKGVPVEIVDIAADDRPANDLPITEVKVPKCFSGTDVKLGLMHKLKRVVYSVCLAGKLKKILKESNEKVVLHFHNQYNLFFFLKLVSPAVRKKAEIAYTVHSYVWPAAWDEIKDTVQKRYFQEVYCVQNADYVLVLNDKTKEHFVQHLGVPAERIYKMDNGVNTDIYSVLTEEETEKWKHCIGLDGKLIVFQVGSVCDRKNQLGAVQMLRDYLREHSDVVYAYAGGVIDAAYQEQILQYAHENQLRNQVRYLGELSPGVELNRYYNMASVTVFPSKIESFGLVIIESIAAGTPVLVAGRPLFPLEHGCMVYNSDAEFINDIDQILRENRCCAEGRKEVCSGYSWEKIAADHLKIWNMHGK